MKKIRAIYLIYYFFLCAFTTLHAQETNIRIKDTKSDNDILVGEVTREGLISIGNWFQEAYDNYKPDTAAISYMKRNKEELPNIFLVLGTWCGDSKEHVPHFYKIIDLVDYPEKKIFVLAVDRDKKASDFCLADFEINMVPTFILTRGETELGRIIETPLISIEKDIVNILSQ